ncbi:glutathione S-transferase family protein [Sphingorhabdus sp. SMR4y]|uniref:glutathione S-transferase family protein n=1 Tax=Sphingorhabdus sp. SMR4y TaxID=2584094 RepID=UPI000B5CD10E|nr:glutathione S-transferase family protein [Sphingorhabdus sp. SMR4y]ASK89952.1 glutathionine S-transferase [Sphingorhabdus sp. SMR4y]
MIKLHHLEFSRSSRIIWLCEEGGIEYEMIRYARDPATRRSPPELGEIHRLAKAPTVEVDGHVMVESAAIIEYLVERHSDGALGVPVDHPERAKYLEWLHFAEGTMGMSFIITGIAPMVGGLPDLLGGFLNAEVAKLLDHLEIELEGKDFLVADKFTGADINLHYMLEGRAALGQLDSRPNCKRYFETLAARPGYQKTVELGGPVLLPRPR